MKFGHLLKDYQDVEVEKELPTVDYKKLKKLLKQVAEVPGAAPAAEGEAPQSSSSGQQPPSGQLSGAERAFLAELNEDLLRINGHYMEKEEEAVIRLQALEERAASPRSTQEADALRTALIDLHGEMVLLLHWSLVNYAAAAKILKKHDKLTGRPLRAPYLSNVLTQPFLSTESISGLVRRAEGAILLVGGAPPPPAAAPTPASPQSASPQQQQQPAAPGAALGPQEAALLKRTRAALDMLHSMRSQAHTPSTLLPPGLADVAATLAEGEAAQEPGCKRARPSPPVVEAH